MARGRTPDFVVIGTMKSGTTTLFEWLGAQPGCTIPAVKEPAFFSDDRAWARGVDWYRAHFDAPTDVITGEASVSYTDPDRTAIAAERLVATIPDARLVCVLREPFDRLRSHYVHERQRDREARPFAEAVTPTSRYVASSSYFRCLEPWLDATADGQLLVVRFEDVFESGDAWPRVLDHLGLAPAARPLDAHNASGTKARLRPVARWLFERRVRRVPAGTPAFVRRAARRLLLAERMDADALALDARTAPIPPESEAVVRADVARLAARLGTGPWWPSA